MPELYPAAFDIKNGFASASVPIANASGFIPTINILEDKSHATVMRKGSATMCPTNVMNHSPNIGGSVFAAVGPPVGISRASTLSQNTQTRVQSLAPTYLTQKSSLGLIQEAPTNPFIADRTEVFYLSELLPRKYDQQQRAQLLRIFRHHAPYIPSCVTAASPGLDSWWHFLMRHLKPTDAPSRAGAIFVDPPLGPNGRGWPKATLPVEVVENIVKYMPRDDLQNLRRACPEIEKTVSSVLFRSVVVPFRPEIYGMMLRETQKQDPEEVIQGKGKGKGKERAIEPDDDDDTDHLGRFGRVKAKDVYDGLKVFKAWGEHIHSFAMAFEFNEGMHILNAVGDRNGAINTQWVIFVRVETAN